MCLRRLVLIGINLISALTMISCDQPYNPTQEPPIVINKETSSDKGKIYSINSGMQICNPNISEDTVNFKGCMLWLNFSGSINVIPPANMSSSYPLPAREHDRLTISDTLNTVRWFFMVGSLGQIFGTPQNPDTGRFQKPRWSTHPNYISTVAGPSNEALPFSGYIINLANKSFLKFNNQKLPSTSAPQVCISDTAKGGSVPVNPQYDADGNVDQTSIAEFLGTNQVKIAYSKLEGTLTLYYIDYTSANPSAIRLPKPTGHENWNVESPRISHDGNWVTYNCYEQVTGYESYVQELKPNSTPVLIQKNAFDPHWWINPRDHSLEYIVYATPTYEFVKEDLSDPALLTSGSAGSTYLQQIEKFSGLPGAISCQLIGDPHLLVPLPFKGGFSPDGQYLGTGYAYAYIMQLF